MPSMQLHSGKQTNKQTSKEQQNEKPQNNIEEPWLPNDNHPLLETLTANCCITEK